MYDVLIPKAYFVKLLENLAAMVEEQKDYLTHLDAQIGDSDHGVNLSIGFREVMKKLPDLVAQDVDIATLLKKSGMSLLSRVGGASGPLYGSLFMKLGAPVAGKNEVTFAELCEMIKSGIDAVVSRGKAELGDKTMVDALLPARDALFAGMEEGLKPLDVMEKAGATNDDTEDIAAFVGQLEGLLHSATIRELKPGECKISMRTNANYLDASAVCAHLGGGGHKAAAGCTVMGSVEEAREAILKAIDQELNRN